MKKIFTNLFLFILLFSAKAICQLNYTVNQYNTTYTSLVNATNAALNNPTPTGYYEEDEGFANAVPIGFNFIFDNTTYTKLNINVNGFLSFGGDFPMQVDNKFSTNSLIKGPLYPNMKPLIAPLWDDLRLQNTSSLKYKLTGNAPNRVFTIEWDNVKWSVSSLQVNVAFQVKLYETTNAVEFTYKTYNNAVSNASASIGLASSNGAFISLNRLGQASTVVEDDNIGAAPNDNVVFKFEPCKVALPISLKVDSYNSRKINFSWNSTSLADYEYAISTTAELPTNFTYTTLKNVGFTNLMAATQYYLHVRAIVGSNKSGIASYAFKTAQEKKLPYAENFENEIVPNAPSAITISNPTNSIKWVTEKISNTPPYNTAISCKGDSVNTANAWFMLPGIELEAGKSYKIRFKYKVTDTLAGKQKIEIRLGNTFNNSTTGWATIYKNYKISETTFKDTSIIFAPNTNDVWFIAFRNITDKNNATLYIDNIEVASLVPLPAKIVNFNGSYSDGKNFVSWKTTSEVRCQKFELQKSIDGVRFTSIKFIASKSINGNSLTDLDYNTTDSAAFDGTTYYQLKMYNLDNTVFYSQVIAIKAPLPMHAAFKKIFPNPTVDIITGIITSPSNIKGDIILTNTMGKVLYTMPLSTVAGDNLFTINVSNYAKGIYYIKFINKIGASKFSALSFVKQ